MANLLMVPKEVIVWVCDLIQSPVLAFVCRWLWYLLRGRHVKVKMYRGNLWWRNPNMVDVIAIIRQRYTGWRLVGLYGLHVATQHDATALSCFLAERATVLAVNFSTCCGVGTAVVSATVIVAQRGGHGSYFLADSADDVLQEVRMLMRPCKRVRW